MLKIDAVLFIVGLLHLSHLSSPQPPPPPPNLSNSFSTKIRQLNVGTVVEGQLFFNYELKKELQIIELGGSNSSGAGKVHIFDDGHTKKEYQYFEPFDYCMMPPVEVTLLPVWSWLANATFNGTKEFQGKQVNVWTLKNKAGLVVTEAGFLTLDNNTPVFLISAGTGGPMIFEDYDDTPPPESKFTIPSSCKGALPPEGAANFQYGTAKPFDNIMFRERIIL